MACSIPTWKLSFPKCKQTTGGMFARVEITPAWLHWLCAGWIITSSGTFQEDFWSLKKKICTNNWHGHGVMLSLASPSPSLHPPPVIRVLQIRKLHINALVLFLFITTQHCLLIILTPQNDFSSHPHCSLYSWWLLTMVLSQLRSGLQQHRLTFPCVTMVQWIFSNPTGIFWLPASQPTTFGRVKIIQSMFYKDCWTYQTWRKVTLFSLLRLSQILASTG